MNEFQEKFRGIQPPEKAKLSRTKNNDKPNKTPKSIPTIVNLAQRIKEIKIVRIECGMNEAGENKKVSRICRKRG